MTFVDFGTTEFSEALIATIKELHPKEVEAEGMWRKALDLLSKDKFRGAMARLQPDDGGIPVEDLAHIIFLCQLYGYSSPAWTKGFMEKQATALELAFNQFGWMFSKDGARVVRGIAEMYRKGAEQADPAPAHRARGSRRKEQTLLLELNKFFVEIFPEAPVKDRNASLSDILSLIFPGEFHTPAAVRVNLYRLNRLE